MNVSAPTGEVTREAAGDAGPDGRRAAGSALPVMRVRWLGRVPYPEAYDLQHRIFDTRVRGDGEDYLILVEHPHVYTRGRRTDPGNLLRTPEEYAALGAEVVEANRGGDVTYHGPGQLVGYPILRLGAGGRRPDVVAHVRSLEELVLRTLADFGIPSWREEGYSGVWTEHGKIAQVGCRITRGVSMHGFALNVACDISYFGHIVPCGIEGRTVTSMNEILGDGAPGLREVTEALIGHAGAVLGREVGVAGEMWPAADRSIGDTESLLASGPSVPGATPEASTPVASGQRPIRVTSLRARVVDAGPDVRSQARSRPDWLRNRARLSDPGFMELKGLMRTLSLNTVCEEAGCPNIYECWGEGTATLMILGRTCTRSCGFCEVDTGRPPPEDPEEHIRVANAVEAMGLSHAVLTSVARDDLADGGASAFAASVHAIRERRPECAVEVLVPDFKGDAAAARIAFAARPDIFNHNLESVARLQRLIRPQAGYARSLTLLSRAKDAGLVTKSGLMCGLGETTDELLDAMADLRAVGVDILTVGQYLRPSARHLPVERWVHPDEFDLLREQGLDMGFAHVESGPLSRSSYHARAAAQGT